MRAPKRTQISVNAFPLARDFEISIDSKGSILIEVNSKTITLEVLQSEKDNYVCKLHLHFTSVLAAHAENDFITPEQLANLKLEAFCEDCSNELHDKFIYYLKFIALDEEIWKVNVVYKDNEWLIEKAA